MLKNWFYFAIFKTNVFKFRNTIWASQVFLPRTNPVCDTAVSVSVAGDQRESISTSTTLDEPACRRCRNHGILVPWKRHKRVCPFTYEISLAIQVLLFRFYFPLNSDIQLHSFLFFHYNLVNLPFILRKISNYTY